MRFKLWNLYASMQARLMNDEGQDLIEYALVVALVAFAATAGMTTLAGDINAAFTQVGGTLNSYIT